MAKWKFKFNLMGTPKSGTTAMSKYMKYSIDRHAIFPHENHVPRAPENLGTSSGFWWIDHPWYPYGHQKDWQTYGEDFTYAQCDYDFRIMLIRKPLPTINSLIRLLSMDRKTCLRQDTKEKIESTRWYEDLGFEFYYPNKIHMAMSVYVNTYEYIMENVELDGVVRIEHAEEDFNKIKGTGVNLDPYGIPPEELNLTKPKNKKNHRYMDWEQLHECDINKTNLVDRAINIGHKFGYT